MRARLGLRGRDGDHRGVLWRIDHAIDHGIAHVERVTRSPVALTHGDPA